MPELPLYLADINGDGWLEPSDADLVRRALFSRRGFTLTPGPGYDFRADVFGRGLVDPIALASVSQTIARVPVVARAARRPVTIAWHYGWYNTPARQPGHQTVRFLGGDYASADPDVEDLFHALKNEFGVTVDALSWIPPRANRDLLANYWGGYFAAPQISTRHVGLLYESTLALPASNRIDLRDQGVYGLLLEDFAHMGRYLAAVRDRTPARVFALDGRPVIFIFGTHAWGRERDNPREFDILDAVVQEARARFALSYAAPPYLVGEEMLLSPQGAFLEDRRRRTINFDAVFIYHHAANIKPGGEATYQIDERYLSLEEHRLERVYEAVAPLRNRFTEQKILVIPSLAPGFAKPGFPTLQTDRAGYADFIKRVAAFHARVYLESEWSDALGTARLPAPLYSVGSWNEEFEGHCLFPCGLNLALREVRQRGFDIPMALREALGWNHYAGRDLL